MQKIQKEKVYLKRLDKEVVLDFFTMADDEYYAEKYGEQRMQQALEKMEGDILLDIFWRQLSNDSKRLISATRVFSWDGFEEKPMEFSDPVEKLKHIVSGADELIAIWMAIITTKRKSLPEVVENVKKKVKEEGSSQK
jgi:hypothetical protein